MGGRRTIGFVLFDQALALNLNGPAEAFSIANHVLSQTGGGYDLVFLSEAGGLVRTSCACRSTRRAWNRLQRTLSIRSSSSAA